MRAEADLLEIGSYTLKHWGAAQAALYLDDLERCCQQLADSPTLGRSCEYIRPGLQRMERGRHVIFYRQQHSAILVSRILHNRMLPEKHLVDDSED